MRIKPRCCRTPTVSSSLSVIMFAAVASIATASQRAAFVKARHGACLATRCQRASIVQSPTRCNPSPDTLRRTALFDNLRPLSGEASRIPWSEVNRTRLGPSRQRQQYRSVSTTPTHITIPPDRIDMQFIKSSGAGGQNVNKVNTQVEIGFQVNDATWMPDEVRERFKHQQSSRINQHGYFRLSVQEHRTQVANRRAAMQKLQDLVQLASIRPKERKMRQGLSIKTKEQRKEFKRRRGAVKESRRRVDDF